MDDWGIFWCIKVTWTLENLNDRNFKDINSTKQSAVVNSFDIVPLKQPQLCLLTIMR